MEAIIKYSIRETFASSKDLEIIPISVNVNIPTLAYAQAVREGMFTLTHVKIISKSLKLENISLIEHFITKEYSVCFLNCPIFVVVYGPSETTFMQIAHSLVHNLVWVF